MTRGVVGLIGAGNLGPVLARRLREAGWRIGTVSSRRLESAELAAAFLGEGKASDENVRALDGADLLLVAVPDREIGTVAEELRDAGRDLDSLLALHHSGALSSEALAPLRRAGASVGSLHPLQTFADRESAGRRLRETYLFFEGDDPDRVRAIAEDLGGRPVPIETGAKTLYHAGAAAACNLAVAMIDLGVELLGLAGIPREDGLDALMPLLRGTLENLAAVGLPDALTGPVERGDAETVGAHLRAIGSAAPSLLRAYAGASEHAVRIARAKGTITESEAKEMRRILESATRGDVDPSPGLP